jgi:hypothetical protein
MTPDNRKFLIIIGLIIFLVATMVFVGYLLGTSKIKAIKEAHKKELVKCKQDCDEAFVKETLPDTVYWRQSDTTLIIPAK